MDYPALRLRKQEARRLRGGHLWVFSNEVDTARTPLKGLTRGQLVRLEDAEGKALGIAYANPESLIAARLLSRSEDLTPGVDFFVERILRALRLRERFFATPHYRLIFGESDGLPGLVVDRFGSLLVMQSGTAGMDALEGELIEALKRVLDPTAILIRNTSGLRALEGLDSRTEWVHGSLEVAEVIENGAMFNIDPVGGQKTGWFYDHRENRARLAPLAQGRRVLDLFAYSGAWGIQAAKAGALAVDAVDASASALSLLVENARRNAVSDRLKTHEGDVFDFLKEARDQGERWDVVVVDPPAFIKRKKDLAQGTLAYRRLNQMALEVLSPEGCLVSASCSSHLSEASLMEQVRSSARPAQRHLSVFYRGGQGPDHPVHPAIPETGYLKAIFAWVSPGDVRVKDPSP